MSGIGDVRSTGAGEAWEIGASQDASGAEQVADTSHDHAAAAAQRPTIGFEGQLLASSLQARVESAFTVYHPQPGEVGWDGAEAIAAQLGAGNAEGLAATILEQTAGLHYAKDGSLQVKQRPDADAVAQLRGTLQILEHRGQLGSIHQMLQPGLWDDERRTKAMDDAATVVGDAIRQHGDPMHKAQQYGKWNRAMD